MGENIVRKRRMRRNTTELKRTQKALGKNEEGYRRIVEQLPGMIYRAGTDWVPTICGEYASVLTGYSIKDIISGKVNWLDLIHPEDRERIVEEASVLKKKPCSIIQEYRIVRKDGKIAWVQDRKKSIQEQGKTRYVEGIVLDITKRKKVEEKLRGSESKFKAVFENAGGALFIADVETGELLDCNAEAERLIGRPKKEIIGMHQTKLHPKGEEEKYREKFTFHVQKGRLVDLEGEVQHVDGRKIPVVISAQCAKLGDKNAIIGLFMDVTEQKRIEAILRQSENKYRTLLENLPQKIFLKDRNSVYITCNENYARDLKIKSEEITGKTDFDFYPKELAEKYRADDKRIMESGEKEEIEEKYIQQGKEIIVHTVKTPVRDEERNTIGILGIFWDITARKKAKEALKESEEKYRTLVDEVRDGYFITDDKGTLKFANKALVGILGYGNQEGIIGRHFLEFVSPEMKNEMMNMFTEAVTTGKFPELVEVLVIKKDGSKIFLQFKPVPILEKGNIIGTRGIMRDISELKKAEEVLRESEERYRHLFEGSPIGIGMATIDGNVITGNKTMLDTLGYSLEEFKHMNLTYIYEDPADRKRVVESVSRYGSIVGFHTRLKHKDGTIRDVLLNVSQLNFRGTMYLQTICQDITELKKIEEALKESEEKYRQLVSTSSDAIMVFDADTRQFIEVNKACEDLYGYRREEFINLKIDDITAELEKTENSINKTLKGKLHKIPLRYHRKKDGTVFPVEISASNFMLRGSKVLCGVVRDITERKKAEERIRVYQEQLRSLASELSLAEERERRKLAMELHDQVGQTLAITKIKLGALQELASSTNLAESAGEICKLIEQAIQNTRSLTFELSPPILYELGLEAAVEWLTEQIQRWHGIVVEFEGDRGHKPLDDNIRIFLFLAVRELLINVVKHAKARRAKVVIRRGNDNIRITVQDDGAGFDSSEIVSSSNGRTGFGLFSIRERLSPFGGHLDIESQRNKGTRFTIVVPLKRKKNSSKRR